MLTIQGEVLHAGANNRGQRGSGEQCDLTPSPTLHRVDLDGRPAADIACGAGHVAVALASGAAVSWGDNDYGQLGRGCGYDWERGAPWDLIGIQGVESVYAGPHTTFLVLREGDVYACGQNDYGQLGLGHAEPKVRTPQRVEQLSGRRVAQLQAGYTHCILLDYDGEVLVWGMLDGKLVNSSTPWCAMSGCIPTRLDLAPAACVAAGPTSCAVVMAESGMLLLWGEGYSDAPCYDFMEMPGGGKATAAICGRGAVFARSAAAAWAACGADSPGRPFRRGGELAPLNDGALAAYWGYDWAPACVPFSGNCSDFELYLSGRGVESAMRRSIGFRFPSGVLRIPEYELYERDLCRPLSDLGVSSECVVELLRAPQLFDAEKQAASPTGGMLVVFVDATQLGVKGTFSVELHSEATALDLVAAAAQWLGLWQ